MGGEIPSKKLLKGFYEYTLEMQVGKQCELYSNGDAGVAATLHLALYCMQLSQAALAMLWPPMIYRWDRVRLSDVMRLLRTLYRTRLRRQALSFPIIAQIQKQHFSTPALKFFPVRVSQHQLQRLFFFLTLPA